MLTVNVPAIIDWPSRATAATSSRGRRRGQLLQGRLVDVGDAWRALLLGAPPSLL